MRTVSWIALLEETASTGECPEVVGAECFTLLNLVDIATLLKETPGLPSVIANSVLQRLSEQAQTSRVVTVDDAVPASRSDIVNLKRQYNYNVWRFGGVN